MPVTIKTAPRLIRPAGSHHLSVESVNQTREPFSKEELWPILEVDAPRAGLVRASFEVSRYVASYWDRDTDTNSDQWGPWRVYLKDVRTPSADYDRGDKPAAGIGDATRDAIAAACEPLIRAWLESDDYQTSRRRAAGRAVAQTIDAPRGYAIDTGRQLLERTAGDLDPEAAAGLLEALDALDRARQLVDAATATS